MTTKQLTREDRVAEFNRASGGKTQAEGGNYLQQTSCFSEELAEFGEALTAYILNPSETTRANMIKEWADVQVTLSNFAWFFDFDGQVAFTRVADNNLTKIGPNGEVTRNEQGKVLKPEGYEKVSMLGL